MLSFSLLILAPVENTDLSIKYINCSGYVSVNIFIKFLSTVIPNKNQDKIGINDIKMKHQNTIIGMNYMNIKKTDNTINKTKKSIHYFSQCF